MLGITYHNKYLPIVFQLYMPHTHYTLHCTAGVGSWQTILLRFLVHLAFCWVPPTVDTVGK